jgi:nitrate reductase NapD
MRPVFDRRQLLKGLVAAQPSGTRHVSSVLVHVLPQCRAAVIGQLSQIPGAEIHGEANGKIIVVLEASNSSVIGEHVLKMSLLEGVIAASLVYEQSYDSEDGENTA